MHSILIINPNASTTCVEELDHKKEGALGVSVLDGVTAAVGLAERYLQFSTDRETTLPGRAGMAATGQGVGLGDGV
jgi:Asp/Glu/hydantoin racemase